MSRGPMRRGLPPAAGISVPADRRFRRAEVTPDRRRVGRTIWRIARWVVPMVTVVGLAGWAVRWAMTSDLLTVRRVSVRGNTRLSAGEIVALVDGLKGEHILRTDLDQYRRQVLDSPWVADAKLSRLLPSTIQIVITERVPMAVARAGTQLFLVDDTGTIIDEYGEIYRDLDLPIVDGLIHEKGAADGTAATAAGASPVVLTSALMTALEPRRDLMTAVSQVDVTNPRDAVVMLDGDPTWLHLGDQRFVERLQNYLELRPTFQERFPHVDYVDLRYDQRIYVHEPGAGSGAAGRAKPAKR